MNTRIGKKLPIGEVAKETKNRIVRAGWGSGAGDQVPWSDPVWRGSCHFWASYSLPVPVTVNNASFFNRR